MPVFINLNHLRGKKKRRPKKKKKKNHNIDEKK